VHIFITGAKGQLGGDAALEALRRGWRVTAVDRGDFDLTDPVRSITALALAKPDAVLHCAAYTAVDQAESEAGQAAAVNAAATQVIAEYCRLTGTWLAYISTDYVFDGSGDAPRDTDAIPAPLNVYGQTKLAGELAAACCEKHMIIRTSWVFGRGGGNFVKTMRRLGSERAEIRVVNDQIGAPTYTVDLARLLCDMLARPVTGVYHATNAGYCSWADFAREIMVQTKLPAKIVPIPTAEYPQAALRPKNGRLSPASLLRAGYTPLPGWEDALGRFLGE
jgi:dTDP-4-dehydrorhamnose reductase